MNLLTPKGLLASVSAWKMLSYVAFLLWNAESIPSEVNSSVNMVYMNVILAYAIYYQIPYFMKMMESSATEAVVIQEGLHRITMNKDIYTGTHSLISIQFTFCSLLKIISLQA